MLHKRIYHALNGDLAQEALVERVRTGRELFGGTVLTEQEIVYKHKLRWVYMPYAEIAWAYRRVEESHVTLGCCGGVLQEFRVVMRDAEGRQTAVSFEREHIAIAVLEELEKRCPDAAIGYTKENRQRFGVPEKQPMRGKK